MGFVKREMERDEHKKMIALQIAVESGVLSTCEFHPDIHIEGDNEIEQAYKLGNFRFTEGSISDVFDSRREMTDLIKEAVEENSGDCYCCAKIMKE